ncbi:MAG: DUF2480 family protein [Saprospiraceae bacterium]|nr:DUF2480 family protein [Saprospiraceae bacterium]
MEEQILVNKVDNSGLITIDLEKYYPQQSLFAFDLKDYLFQGLILKEKDFREALKAHDWNIYQGGVLCVFCSSDAIIPVWAYMLVSSHAAGHAAEVFTGNKENYLMTWYEKTIRDLDIATFEGKRIVIKGCSDKPVPASAYAAITSKLIPAAQSIMYGEPCSTVPVYKRPRF